MQLPMLQVMALSSLLDILHLYAILQTSSLLVPGTSCLALNRCFAWVIHTEGKSRTCKGRNSPTTVGILQKGCFSLAFCLVVLLRTRTTQVSYHFLFYNLYEL